MEIGCEEMEKKKRNRNYIKVFILSACCLVFILSVVGVFALFLNRLNDESSSFLSGGLAADRKEHQKRTELVVSSLNGMMELLQGELEADGSCAPGASWELMVQESRIQIDYLDANELSGLDKDSVLTPLAAGEELIFEPGSAELSEENDQFTFLYPVFNGGNLSGALCAQIDGSLLIAEGVNEDSIFQKVYLILASPDGSVIYADTPYPDNGNLFSAVFQGGIGSDEVEDIQSIFEETDTMTIRFPGKGNDYYMSWEPLGLRDWRLILFARSPDVVFQTTKISRGMIMAGIGLILLTGVFCTALIFLLLRQKHQLDMQRKRYDALAQFNDTLLFEYDVAANRLIFTPNAVERLDLNEKCLEGISGEYYIAHLIHPDDREGVRSLFRSTSIALDETYYMEARFRCRNGEYNWFGCQFKSIEKLGEETRRVVGKLVDISDQRGREQLLRQAALADALTGVYNRSAEVLIDNLLAKDRRGLFFMIDLDDFKHVNDTYGHAAGDTLLVGIAQILREGFRSNDIIARVGGDEFIAFIPGVNDSETAENKAAIIQKRMEHLYIPGCDRAVSASIGAASAPRDGSCYAELASAADRAMYTIKQQSKNGFAFHEYTDSSSE